MNVIALASALRELTDRPVAEMSDEELALWLMVCGIMERKSNRAKSPSDWKAARFEAEAEIGRRNAIAIGYN
jgi:hypothetical protein